MEENFLLENISEEQRASIREEIDNDIEMLIKEELSISTELSNAANDIIRMLEDSIKQEKSKPVNIQGVSFKEGSVEGNYFGKTIIVKYWFYNFFDKVYYEQQRKRIREVNRNNNIDRIEITIFAISGHIIEDTLYDTIYHELEHIFQQTKADKMFTKTDLYAFMVKRRDEVKENTPEYVICDSIYMTYNFEEDAYINGAYGFLMKVCKSYLDVDETLPRTQLYKIIELMKFYKEVFVQYRNQVSNILNTRPYIPFHLTVDKLLKRLDKATERVERKVKNLKKKVKKDIAEKTGEIITEHKRYTQEEMDDIRRKIIENFNISDDD